MSMQFYIDKSHIGLCTLLVCVWDWDRFGKVRFLGKIQIPLSNIANEEINRCWYKLQLEVSAIIEYYQQRTCHIFKCQ